MVKRKQATDQVQPAQLDHPAPTENQVEQEGRSAEPEKEVEKAVVVQPKRQSTPGKSYYPYYCLETTPSLVKFRGYLQGLDGGKSIDKATQIMVDVSKFLYYARKSSQVDWGALADMSTVRSYLSRLNTDGIQVEGQLTKLQ